MRLRIKGVALALGAALVLGLFPGCASTNASNNKVTLLFSYWDTNQQAGMQSIINAFEKQHPNIEINLQVTPWDSYWTKLQANAEGGQMPDIFWMHASNELKFAKAGKLLEIPSNSLDWSQYPSELVGMYTYKGKHYGVPKDFDTIGLWYNKQIFDAKGIPYPDDTWDWNKMETVAKELTDPSKGIYGYLSPCDQQQGFYSFIYQNGGSVINSGYTKSTWDQQANIDALRFAINFAQVDKSSPTTNQFASTNNIQYFTSGKGAMLELGSWNMNQLMSDANVQKFGDVAVLPKGKVRATMLNGLSYAVGADTKHPKEALEFAEFAGSKEANILQAESGAAIPAYTAVDDVWVNHFNTKHVKSYIDMLPYAVLYPQGFDGYAAFNIVETTIANEMYTKQISVENGVKQLQKNMNDALAGNLQ